MSDAHRLRNKAAVLLCAAIVLSSCAVKVPIIADTTPTVTEDFKLTASDFSKGDYFGWRVSISGDTAIIGSVREVGSGSAYVFKNNGKVWTQQAKLIAKDVAVVEGFGASVAISGDTAVVGAHKFVDDRVDTGSVYIFIRNGTEWKQQTKLVASDVTIDNGYGCSVSMSGDTIIVGNGRSNKISADVYIRSDSEWKQQAKLTVNDSVKNVNFDQSVSISEDTAIIGASPVDISDADPGSAYIFTRSGGEWKQQAKLSANDAVKNNKFGISVSVAGDTALVGAIGNYDAGAEFGSAYVFTRSSEVWTQQAKLTTTDLTQDDFFGISVSVTDDIAIVGASMDSSPKGDFTGSAYVFTRKERLWTQKHKFNASNAATGHMFGISVSISGDTALVGASGAGFGDEKYTGSAYIFDLAKRTP